MYFPVAEINLRNLEHNYRYLQSLAGEAKILAVVKADAYGHGLAEVAKALDKTEIFGFSVALFTEVMDLIAHGIKKPILHLGRLNAQILAACKFDQVRCTVNSFDDLELIRKRLQPAVRLKVHLKVDTGMGRMGVPYSAAEEVLRKLKQIPNIILEGIWSHFATAEDRTSGFREQQLDKFKALVALAKKTIPTVSYFHIANSAALLDKPAAHFNMVRPGVALFGVSPFREVDPNLRPVMQFKAPLVLIREMVEGDTIGYGRTFTVPENGKYGVIQAGYADGVPLEFSNSAALHHKSSTLRVTGRVSMDMTSVNCNGSSVEEGEMVTIWGAEKEYNRVEYYARQYGKLPYEFLTGVSKRVVREYIR
ncbi:MAG: alanine racemase [FCB group bacterium]|nr:alanine racemase [FCB group bacterium]